MTQQIQRLKTQNYLTQKIHNGKSDVRVQKDK